jgi:Cu+-exporting ATPase
MPVIKDIIELHVSGMTCEGCASRITKVLERLEGVHEARVTLEEETARVDYDRSQVDTGVMKQAIEKAGYEVE